MLRHALFQVAAMGLRFIAASELLTSQRALLTPQAACGMAVQPVTLLLRLLTSLVQRLLLCRQSSAFLTMALLQRQKLTLEVLLLLPQRGDLLIQRDKLFLYYLLLPALIFLVRCQLFIGEAQRLRQRLQPRLILLLALLQLGQLPLGAGTGLRVAPLPVQQRAQRLRRLRRGKVSQIRRCGLHLLRGLQGRLLRLRQRRLPLRPFIQPSLMALRVQPLFLLPPLRQFVLERRLLLTGQHFNGARAGFPLRQLVADRSITFKYIGGDAAIDIGARQLLEQPGAAFGVSIQKRGKIALRQQNGFGKLRKIQSRQFGYQAFFIADFIRQNQAVADAGQLHFRFLQITVRLIFRPALAPKRTVADPFNGKLHFGKRFRGMACHQLRAGVVLKAQRLVIKRQTDGIEQRGFSRAGRAGNGEQATVIKGDGGKVDFPFALQRIQVF
nr:hypothetical protein [Candidatus Sodalis pierantonius]